MRPAWQWLAAVAELTRIANPITAGLYTLLGAYLAAGWNGALRAAPIKAAIVVALVVAFGNAINDYVDAPADAIAKPHRPIPSGRLSRRTAGLICVALSVLALVIALTLGWIASTFALATVALSAGYSTHLKAVPLLGNAATGLLCAAILVYGALAAHGMSNAIWAAAAMTFFYISAQEILYAVEDEEGDRVSNVATTVTVFGRLAGIRAFQALALTFTVVALLPWFAGIAAHQYVFWLVPLTLAPVFAMVAALGWSTSAATIARCAQLSRLVWYSSVVSIFLLR